MFTRRTTITFERLEKCFYRVPNVMSVTAGCDQCLADVTWLTPNQVVAISGLTLRELFRRIEADRVHFNETPSGLLLICPNSIDLGNKKIERE